jgi:hypothetical protein
MVQVVLLGALRTLKALGHKWVCSGQDPHGHSEPRIREGRPECPHCQAPAFVAIDEAIRRVEVGLSIRGFETAA